MRDAIFTLNNPNAPRLCPELAVEIGLNESIILLQIEFWIRTSTSEEHDGRQWTYQSVRDIEAFFAFWSIDTINRAIRNLIDMKLVDVGNYNKCSYDRTRWFAINRDGCKKLKSIVLAKYRTPTPQNHTRSPQNRTGQQKRTRTPQDRTWSTQNHTGSTRKRTRSTQNRTRSTRDRTTIPENTTETSAENNEQRLPHKDLSNIRMAQPEITNAEKPEGPPDPVKVDPPFSDAIAAYIEEINETALHDPEHLKSNITNAMNRYRESGIGEDAFMDHLIRARRIVLRQTANIRKTTKSRYGEKNRAPYFFQVLRDLLRGSPSAYGRPPDDDLSTSYPLTMRF